MPSPTAALLAECFPHVVQGNLPDECWVLRAYSRDPHMLAPLSKAIEIVTLHGERISLAKKLSATHPVDRPHNAQYDDRLLDVLTEACAFAWAAEIANLGHPRFCFDEGAPDIWVDSGWWIEAKAKHAPEKERKILEQMLRDGLVVTGQVRGAGKGLYDALQLAFEDAKRKFKNQKCGKLVVFFNITDFGVDQWAIREEQSQDVVEFVDRLAAQEPEIEAVTCCGYNWPEPGRVKLRSN